MCLKKCLQRSHGQVVTGVCLSKKLGHGYNVLRYIYISVLGVLNTNCLLADILGLGNLLREYVSL